ncbi:MAG: acetoin utilization protein AcuC [Woeseiaceae bacterium]|nr:acetoin utilization protein AcuC [Woeseiaceae bacterium]
MQAPASEIRDSAATNPVAAADVDARPAFIGSDVFRRAAFGGNHPLNFVRHSAVLDLSRALGWIDDEHYVTAGPASVEQLLEFHDRAYVKALQYADSEGKVEPRVRTKYQIGTFENPLFPGLFERAATTVGGSILAATLALDGRVAFHPSGGTHHGRRDRACGFCYFNDPVFAIKTFAAAGCERVLYVDLDAHHGDGVQEAFSEDPDVVTVSIHEENRWPYTGKRSYRDQGVYNFPVPTGFHDAELEFLIEEAVLPIAEHHRADAMVLCCGADCLAGDPLSKMELTNVALWDAVDRLLELRLPTVIVGGGGYNPWTVARYWAGMWGRISGQPLPDALPDDALTLLAEMRCELVDEDEVDEAWLTSMADSPYRAPVRDAVRSTLHRAGIA